MPNALVSLDVRNLLSILATPLLTSYNSKQHVPLFRVLVSDMD